MSDPLNFILRNSIGDLLARQYKARQYKFGPFFQGPGRLWALVLVAAQRPLGDPGTSWGPGWPREYLARGAQGDPGEPRGARGTGAVISIVSRLTMGCRKQPWQTACGNHGN